MKTATKELTKAPKQALAKLDDETLDKMLNDNDFRGFTPPERRVILLAMCKKHHIDPIVRPFGFVRMSDGKVMLYAFKSGADALAATYHLSQESMTREVVNNTMIVQTEFVDQDYLASGGKKGRKKIGTGAASMDIKGKAFENAAKKAETQAARRAILSMVCPGVMDETEILDIPGARPEATEAPEPGMKYAGSGSAAAARKKIGRL